MSSTYYIDVASIPTLQQLHMLQQQQYQQDRPKRERTHSFQLDPVRFGVRRQNIGYLAILKKIQRKVKEGDLALPYGHRSYEYKMENPVLLIGATFDEKFTVDMNLARITDGAIKYVEERQAIIKLERDGEFYLRNVGKEFAIRLDGNELAPHGETRKINDQCLITVKSDIFVLI